MEEAKVSFDLPSACYLHNVFLEHLEVIRSTNVTKQLQFHLMTQDLHTSLTREPQTRRFTRCLQFGDSIQDVLSALGSPSRIFYKTEDKMKIHLPQHYRLEQPRRSDYFFNYFTLGVDILFDTKHQRVIKFVLHTNQPGEYIFNSYYRCMFEINLSNPVDVKSINSTVMQSQSGMDQDNSVNDPLVVTPFIKWSTIQQHVDSLLGLDPVVIHRESKIQGNPFGPTHAYGYHDMIFEVIPVNGYLASVTLYAPQQPMRE